MEKLKYQQLADHFRKKIEAGKLRAGEQLPSQQVIQQQFFNFFSIMCWTPAGFPLIPTCIRFTGR
jgi:hypothetical protein